VSDILSIPVYNNEITTHIENTNSRKKNAKRRGGICTKKNIKKNWSKKERDYLIKEKHTTYRDNLDTISDVLKIKLRIIKFCILIYSF
jgi:hypothetical protein